MEAERHRQPSTDQINDQTFVSCDERTPNLNCFPPQKGADERGANLTVFKPNTSPKENIEKRGEGT